MALFLLATCACLSPSLLMLLPCKCCISHLPCRCCVSHLPCCDLLPLLPLPCCEAEPVQQVCCVHKV